jgi:hypothetical protein
MNQNRCRHCHTLFLPNPRIKKQRYCNRPECQRARKALWQKQKMLQDPDYQTTHREAQKTWMEQHPGYWKTYRAEHPAYLQKNRQNQQNRDRKRRLARLAKMDALRPFSFIKPGSYFLAPDLAKMDSLAQKVFLIPDTSTDLALLAKKDSIDPASGFSYHSLPAGGPL